MLSDTSVLHLGNTTEMDIRKTVFEDLEELIAIYGEARESIGKLGIDQWQNGYPEADVIKEDISLGRSYCITEDGRICAAFAVIIDGEPTYDRIYSGSWKKRGAVYIAIHRVAVGNRCRRRGMSSAIFGFCAELARTGGVGYVRIDTHEGNVPMRSALEKNGFEYRGIIYLGDGSKRVAYEKTVLPCKIGENGADRQCEIVR